MSDLISREEVIKLIQQYHGYMPNNINHEMYKKAKEIPTAYDVDKVIEQLEDYGKHKGLLRITDNPTNCDNYVPVREVKKIVKGGGKDEIN